MRSATSQLTSNFVSASIAVHVHTSPASFGGGLGVFYVVVFGVNEIPDFIDLNALAGQVPQHAILVLGAGVTGIDHKLGDGVLAGSGQPGHGADRLTLTKEVKDTGAGITVELVHGPTI